jgi:hypothetical protein
VAIEHVSAVLHGLFDVTPSAKLVMLILAEHSRRGANALSYPSVDRIADMACLSAREVQFILRELKDAGYLHVITGGGRARPNQYRLNLERLALEQRKRCNGVHRKLSTKGETDFTVSNTERVKSDARKGETLPSKGCSPLRERVKPTSPEPGLTGTSLEPGLTGRPVDKFVGSESSQKTETPIDKDPRPKPEPRSTADVKAIAHGMLSRLGPKRTTEPNREKTPEELEAEKQRQLRMLQASQGGTKQ